MSEEIKIEKGIPITPQIHGGKWKNIFLQMEVGDSIVVSKKEYHSLYNCIKRQGMAIVYRAKKDGQYRVWKVENE